MTLSRSQKLLSLICSSAILAATGSAMAATSVDDTLTISDTSPYDPNDVYPAKTTALILDNGLNAADSDWSIINNVQEGGELSFLNTSGGAPYTVPVSISGGWEDALRITSDGKVGMNTATPGGPWSSRLTISDPNLNSIFFDLEGTGSGNNFFFGAAAAGVLTGVGDVAFIGNATTNQLPFIMDEFNNIGMSSGGAPEARLHVGGLNDAKVLVENTQDTAQQLELFEIRNNGNLEFQMNNTNAGSIWKFVAGTKGNVPGGEDSFRISKVGQGIKLQIFDTGNATLKGAWTATQFIQSSDRNIKQDIAAVDQLAVLEKVATLPIAEWSYKDDPSVRHVGPMAQDFHAAFGLGASETGISTIDSGGIALAAVQGVRIEKDKEIAQLKQENAEKSRRLSSLEELQEQQSQRILQLEMMLSELARSVTAEGRVAIVSD